MVLSSKPLFIELFAGLHGWGEGATAEGFRVVGFDIVDMCATFGRKRPVGIDLVLQDVRTLHGSQFKNASVIAASPPCQEFSKYAMPFGALWEDHDRMDDDGAPPGNYLHKPCPNTYLFWTCFRIQKEASEAAGRPIPMIVENVRGAGRFVGKSAWNFGSFHLYGDVPALMPINLKRGGKGTKRGWTAGCAISLGLENYNGIKVPGQVHGTEYAMTRAGANGQTVLGTRDGSKNEGGSWSNVAHNTTSGHGRNPVNGPTPAAIQEGQKVPGFRFDGSGRSFQSASVEATGTKQPGGNGDWFNKEARAEGSSAKFGSKSSARKQASAQIAKIPLALAQHIASVYKPKSAAK